MKIKNLFALLLLLAISVAASAQPGMKRTPDAKGETILLYPEGVPNAYEMPENRFGDYSIPKVTIYKAENPNGICVIECPGGGYYMLSDGHEGHLMADWFVERGYTFCVVSYRMPCGHTYAPLNDVEKAVQIVRSKATELGVDVNKIGVMGTSAGGHLASTLATHYTSEETKPAFQILFYPVISMDPALTHAGSREFLIGKDADQELTDLFSNQKQVKSTTCPAFIVLSADDTVVPPANSLLYMQALVDAGVKGNQLMVFPTGGHGWGIIDIPYKPQWTAGLELWLQQIFNKEERKLFF